MRYLHLWIDPSLRKTLRSKTEGSDQTLKASLALLDGGDPSQITFLEKRLHAASSAELPVVRDALRPYRDRLAPQLLSLLSRPSRRRSVAPAASALADYDASSPRWESVGGKVAQAMVSINSIYLGDWLKYLNDVRRKLTLSLATIFRDRKRSESERVQATDILTNYSNDDPNLVANLLMDAQPKAYASLFPIAQRLKTETLPLFQDEIARTLAPTWNDPPLDLSWTKPDAILTAKIESAQGMFTEHFAFCQTMPLEEFLKVVEQLRPSGYRPTRFRPMRGQEPTGWRRSGLVTGVLGEWLTISPPTRSARATSGTARRDTFRSKSLVTWLRVVMRASPPPASPPCGAENRTERRSTDVRGVIGRRTHEGSGTTKGRRACP